MSYLFTEDLLTYEDFRASTVEPLSLALILIIILTLFSILRLFSSSFVPHKLPDQHQYAYANKRTMQSRVNEVYNA